MLCDKYKKSPIVGTKIALQTEQIEEFMKNTITYLCQNVYSKMQIGDFPTATPKEYIEKLSCDDKRIEKIVENLKNIPLQQELNNDQSNFHNAYIITASTLGNTYIFVTKKNIFMSYSKKFLYCLSDTTYKSITENLVRLIMHFDCIIYGENCYFVTLAGKLLFGLEQNAAEKSKKTAKELIEKNIISSDAKSSIETYMKKSGKSTCLAQVDESIIDELNNITPKNKEKLRKKYKLEIIQDSDGNLCVDVSTEEKMKDFIDTITRKRCLDFNQKVVNCTVPFTHRQQE